MANYGFPIHDATASGDLAEVQRLVALGGEFQGLNAQGVSPLLLAIFDKHTEIIKYLLEQGASVDERDFRGASPLHIATFINNLDIVKLLVESGAYIYAEDNDTNKPIDVALKFGHFEIVKYFLSVGLDVDFCGNEGNSLLHTACQWFPPQPLMVQYLLENGADVNRKCLRIGATPLYLAIFQGYPDIAELLILNGADLIQAEYQGKPNLEVVLARDLYFAEDCAKVIIKYSVLMFIPVNIKRYLFFPFELKKYYNKCQEEITHMKQVLIKNSTVSLHQIICGSFKGNKFVRHLCNDNIKNELNNIEDYLKDFDIYGNIASLVKTNIKKGLQRLRLLNDADLVMKKFTPKLPSEIRWKIFDYLNMTDLTAVIQSDILE